jgi:hypothetical protein
VIVGGGEGRWMYGYRFVKERRYGAQLLRTVYGVGLRGKRIRGQNSEETEDFGRLSGRLGFVNRGCPGGEQI